ncbi:MAG TPA: hypothetical protein VJ975_03525 [Candidatus Limnocylindria bacterium]|nr:hypothetical protein [Candidatus Limnocylindria bacterium]
MVNAANPSAERLARYLTGDATGDRADELAAWIASSPRFRAFADAHRDKIRKKLRGATDDDAWRDVRAELAVAHRLLRERRLDLTFEPAGGQRGGPDFRVTFRDHLAFNLEVTRPRRDPDVTTIGRVMLAKLRQLPPGTANVLLVALDASVVAADVIGAAAQGLRSLADARDAALLERGAFASPRDFYQRYLRLGAVVTWATGAPEGIATSAWVNPSARIAVPGPALRACLAALGAD